LPPNERHFTSLPIETAPRQGTGKTPIGDTARGGDADNDAERVFCMEAIIDPERGVREDAEV